MRWLFLNLIRFYQRFISPLTPPSCIYSPTCSTYAYQAISKYGVLHGGMPRYAGSRAATRGVAAATIPSHNAINVK